MTKAGILTLAVAALVLTGCAGIQRTTSGFFNMFSSSDEVFVPPEVTEVSDPRPLVPQITALNIDRTPNGAIVRATGLPPEQGWFDIALVRTTRSGRPVDGVLTFTFRGVPPVGPKPASTIQSRELVAAVFVPNEILAETRLIRVAGALNSQSARR